LERIVGLLEGFRHRRGRQLADEGYRCLREKEYDQALDVAAKLRKLRYTAGFEIAALANAALGNLEEAVRNLEEGVKLAGGPWLNWQLLGNYRSDLGRYDAAADAFEHALRCPGVWEASVQVNQAILQNRLQNYEGALTLVRTLTDPDLRYPAAMIEVGALAGLGRLEEAEALAARALHEADDTLDDDHASNSIAPYLAAIAVDLARIRLECGADPATVRAFAVDRMIHDETDHSLLALIRDIDNQYSAQAQYYRLLLNATIAETSPWRPDAEGYFFNCDVVADSPEEALSYLRRLDATHDVAHLRVDNVEIIEPRPESPKGVYRWSACFSYNE
jgi:tetratricopeptide (TPR) repeat protein